jgi:hypothetical protein
MNRAFVIPSGARNPTPARSSSEGMLRFAQHDKAYL